MNFILYFILDFKYYGSPLEGFRQKSHIITFCIYEPPGCCVKNELEEGKNRSRRMNYCSCPGKRWWWLGPGWWWLKMERSGQLGTYFWGWPIGFVGFELAGWEKEQNQAWLTGCQCWTIWWMDHSLLLGWRRWGVGLNTCGFRSLIYDKASWRCM